MATLVAASDSTRLTVAGVQSENAVLKPKFQLRCQGRDADRSIFGRDLTNRTRSNAMCGLYASIVL